MDNWKKIVRIWIATEYIATLTGPNIEPTIIPGKLLLITSTTSLIMIKPEKAMIALSIDFCFLEKLNLIRNLLTAYLTFNTKKRTVINVCTITTDLIPAPSNNIGIDNNG
ncbi:hypothetical protein WSSLDB02_02990 [Weissella soli]|nr:hypothetical protein WSSLDB02_02990 [Weissella soli]